MAARALGAVLVFSATLKWGNVFLICAGTALIALGFFVYATGVVSEGMAIPLVGRASWARKDMGNASAKGCLWYFFRVRPLA